MKISFGIIVLNGEPLVKYQLRSLYPHAHQIIVVEGASYNARDSATPDGHSTDGTLETLRRFKKEEDPENKIVLVTAEDEGHSRGFWPGEKDEQSRSYAKRATGDILWQVDIDEFYLAQDIEKIVQLLETRPEALQINLRWKNFWGSIHYLVESFAVEKHYQSLGGGVPRIFRWGKDYYYKTHRPPTVINAEGEELKAKMLPVEELNRLGIAIYHYASIFHRIVEAKTKYHDRNRWTAATGRDWFASNFLKITHPFRVYHITNDISWLERFEGRHPSQIEKMVADLQARDEAEGVTKRADVEALLQSSRYQAGIRRFKAWSHYWTQRRKRSRFLRRTLERTLEFLYSPAPLEAPAPLK